MKRIVSFLFGLSFSFLGVCQLDTTALITSFVHDVLKEVEIVPSVSIAIVRGEKVLYLQSFGHTNHSAKTSASTESQYYIASCTKSYTGLLAHILEDEGVLKLSDPILNYKPFKEFQNKIVFEGITIQDLISHTSGIDNPYLSFRLAYTGEYSDEQIVKLIEVETQRNEKGGFEYSNFGYYLFDYLLRSELGKSWHVLVQEKVIEPLEMLNTTAVYSEVNRNKLAFPYNAVFKEELGVVNLEKSDATMHAAGGIVTSISDAAKFIQLYLDKGQKFIPKEVVERSITEKITAEHEYVRLFKGTAYASGWRIGEFENEKVVYHFGGYTGYYSHYSFLPNKNIGIVVLCNSDMGMTAANLIAKYAYNIYLGNLKELKQAKKILRRKIPKVLANERKAQRELEEKISQRKWNLTVAKDELEGVFYSDVLGTVEILYQDQLLLVKSGNLNSLATPFPTENTMRVELIPGYGTVIGFDVDEGKVVSLYHKREKFKRIR